MSSVLRRIPFTGENIKCAREPLFSRARALTPYRHVLPEQLHRGELGLGLRAGPHAHLEQSAQLWPRDKQRLEPFSACGGRPHPHRIPASAGPHQAQACAPSPVPTSGGATPLNASFVFGNKWLLHLPPPPALQMERISPRLHQLGCCGAGILPGPQGCWVSSGPLLPPVGSCTLRPPRLTPPTSKKHRRSVTTDHQGW